MWKKWRGRVHAHAVSTGPPGRAAFAAYRVVQEVICFAKQERRRPWPFLPYPRFWFPRPPGAPEAVAQDVPRAQAPADDRSYLPPWMQPQASGTGQASMQSQYLNALDDPALKQKAQSQQQKPRKRRSSTFGDFFW